MNPKTKARYIHKALTEIAKESEYSEMDMPTLKDNQVIWVSGPFEWAISALGGESIWCGELGNYSLKAEKELSKLLSHDRLEKEFLSVEAVNSYTLGVY